MEGFPQGRLKTQLRHAWSYDAKGFFHRARSMVDDFQADPFRGLMHPCTVEGFLSSAYGCRPWHGAPDDRSRRRIIDWNDVNQALGCVRAWDDRNLRLGLHGRPVPTPEYCSPHESSSGTVWRPDAERVSKALKAGATLMASGIDGVIPAVGALAESIESALPVRVQANLYCSSAGAAGFPRHEDTHDVLVVHLFGSKRWSVGSPAAASRAGGPDLQHFLLRPGDLLYVPQGWSHEALAEAGPCLHLTLALVHVSIEHIAHMLARSICTPGLSDKPLYDLHLGPQAVAAHLERVVQMMASRAGEGLAAEVLNDLLAGRRVRPRYALPVDHPDHVP